MATNSPFGGSNPDARPAPTGWGRPSAWALSPPGAGREFCIDRPGADGNELAVGLIHRQAVAL